MKQFQQRVEKIYQTLSKMITSLPARHWDRPMRIITLLGGPLFISLMTLAMIIIAVTANRLIVGKIAALIILTSLTNFALKLIFRHLRPNTEYARKIRFSKYSFPSGHSSVGLVLWYSMPILLSSLGAPAGFLLVVALLAPLMVLAIGVSRIYLGAHYLIDVLAGWALGILCMISFAVIVL